MEEVDNRKDQERSSDDKVEKIWGIRKRRFGDWRKRIWLFDVGMNSDGAEVWEWKEREGIEKNIKKYI